MVGSITRWQARLGYLYERPQDQWVPLATKGYLEPVLGSRHVKTVMESLISGGVIECDGIYYPGVSHSGGKKGGKSTTEENKGDKSTTVDKKGGGITAEQDIVLPNRDGYQSVDETGAGGKCFYYRLTPAYRAVPLRPRALASMRLRANIEKLSARHERPEVTDPVHRAIRSWVDRATVAPEYEYGTCDLVDRMVDGETYFVPDPMGRLHHPLTTVPKEHRTHIRVDGHADLVAVDVSCCQPALAGVVICDDLVGPPDELGGAVERWLRDCRDGALYERLMDRVEADTGARPERQVVKQRLLAVMYGQFAHTGTAVGKAVDALYPGLRGEFGRRRAVTRGGFARQLQRRESEIMIQGAAREYIALYPDEVCVTIHDCLLVRERMAEIATGIVRAAWQEAGFAAAVKQERWTVEGWSEG
ncbi:MAG TPA: hypothetical protein VGE74_29800 [Gemmata sp.]